MMKVQNIVTARAYKDKQGEEKKAYTTIGKIFTYDDGGQSILLESVPVGWDGKAAIYDMKERNAQPTTTNKGGGDLPF